MEKEKLIEVKNYLEKYKVLGNYFRNFSKMYIMTTENINGFLNKYDLKDKSVLTVAGSGDQRLNSYLLGAKDVTCFDINPLTELHLKLKDAVIKNLDYDKFLYFFDIYSNKYNKEQCSKVHILITCYPQKIHLNFFLLSNVLITAFVLQELFFSV